MGADGTFYLEGVVAGKQRLAASCPGFMSTSVTFGTWQRPDADLDVFLKAGDGRIHGTVRDQEGHPVAYAWVEQGNAQTVCDEAGRYSLENLPEGRRIFVVAAWPRYVNICPEAENRTVSEACTLSAEAKEATRLDLVLPAEAPEEARALRAATPEGKPGGIAGRVLTAEGRPARNFKVRLFPLTERVESDSSIQHTEWDVHFTREDGRFVMGYEECGKLARVEVFSEGYAKTVCEPVLIVPLARTGVGPVREFRLRPLCDVKVRVREEGRGNAPVQGAQVRLLDLRPGWRGWNEIEWPHVDSLTERTNAQGCASFSGVPFEEGLASVCKAGYGRECIVWRQGERQADVLLSAGARIHGQMVLPDTADPRKASVSIRFIGDGLSDPNKRNYGSISLCRNDESFSVEGNTVSFLFEELAPAWYELRLSYVDDALSESDVASQRVAMKDEFQLAAGETLDVHYPEDAIVSSPEQWLAQSDATGRDTRMMGLIPGCWWERHEASGGTPVIGILQFDEDGGWERWGAAGVHYQELDGGSHRCGQGCAFSDRGWFKIEEGTLKLATEGGGLMVYCEMSMPDEGTHFLCRARGAKETTLFTPCRKPRSPPGCGG